MSDATPMYLTPAEEMLAPGPVHVATPPINPVQPPPVPVDTAVESVAEANPESEESSPAPAPVVAEEPVKPAESTESVSPPAAPAPSEITLPPAAANDVVLSSALDVYRDLVQKLDLNKQTIQNNRRDLAHVRQQIRELSALSKRDPRMEDETNSHGLHASKVAAQYDDCGSIIAYAEQVRKHVYDNATEAENLLSPMIQSMGLLKFRVRHIRLLEELLSAQESGMQLEIQLRNADACIRQLSEILKVKV